MISVMAKMWFVALFLNVLLKSGDSDLLEDPIFQERKNLLDKEFNMTLGNDIVLNDNEQEANKIIMDLKHEELIYAFENPQVFHYSKHFFEYKDEIKKSRLFQIIHQMPKGAVLHAHDTGILSPDYVLKLTYMDNLYICFEGDIRLLFSNNVPKTSCKSTWQLMKNARYSSGNVEKFDADLRKYFTIVVNKPNDKYKHINAVWDKFQKYFIMTGSFFTYKPVWEQYFYDTLKALRDDNVMYFEIRSVLPHLYDLKGNEYDSIETAKTYKEVLDKFLVDYPDFFGAKLIYAPLRLTDKDTVKGYLKTAVKLKQVLPDFFAGFDLVGQEDLGVPTKHFLDLLSEASSKLDYFFHAGETNWFGSTSDENLVDAIVLKSRRIGHAFALVKHPLLLEEVKKRDIALEVNVISNAVLKLVDDVRNHPLASFLAQNLPVVLSCDDPGLWEAEILSHDYYVTFLGVASWHADIRLLKKLALNSLYYSTFHNKDKMIHEFEVRWTKFINNVIKSNTS